MRVYMQTLADFAERNARVLRHFRVSLPHFVAFGVRWGFLARVHEYPCLVKPRIVNRHTHTHLHSFNQSSDTVRSTQPVLAAHIDPNVLPNGRVHTHAHGFGFTKSPTSI